MKHLLAAFAALLTVAVLASPSAVLAKSDEQNAYKMPRTHVALITDRNSDRQYELYIRLPEGYSHTAETPYPVIYSTDAAWHMEMLAGSTEYLMSNAVVVGISWQTDLESERAHASRSRDFTIIKYETIESPTGEASNHLKFIRDDVISYIENNYRVDPAKRAYFGYSAGGEFGAYALLAQPNTFRYYILGSPAFDQPSINYLDQLERETVALQREKNLDVFLSVGEQEKADAIKFTKEFASILQRRKAAGLILNGPEIIENSNHGTAFPETVIRAVKWLAQLTEE